LRFYETKQGNKGDEKRNNYTKLLKIVVMMKGKISQMRKYAELYKKI